MDNYLDILYSVFIEKEQYMLIIHGLIFTLEVTLTAAIIGVILGVLLTLMTITDIKPFRHIKNRRLQFLKNFNPVQKLARLYITVIRGTPTVVQLLILYNLVFIGSFAAPVFVVASLAFGLNSAAYVAEIIRAGIQGLDKGQMEAARALGMSYKQSMKVLLKETSIVGMISGMDLTAATRTIANNSYRAVEPWIAVALIYLILTSIFTYFMHKVEMRLKESD